MKPLGKVHKIHTFNMATEKLCLKWNDFQNIVQTSFGELRYDSDFTDVTLACEDESIKAHKVILSACSPFFKRLLKTHAHPKPLIYMRGVKSIDLVAIVDFIYQGEVNIFQEQLDSFLSLAEEFELKGLNRSSEEETATEYPHKYNIDHFNRVSDAVKKGNTNERTKMKYEGTDNSLKGALMPVQPKEKRPGSVILDPDTMATIESMLEKRVDGYSCTNCDYFSKQKTHMKEHAEKHIEGLEYPCNDCKKVYRSSHSFRNHKSKGRCCNP